MTCPAGVGAHAVRREGTLLLTRVHSASFCGRNQEEQRLFPPFVISFTWWKHAVVKNPALGAPVGFGFEEMAQSARASLQAQAQGPEFNPQDPFVIPALGTRRQVELWG